MICTTCDNELTCNALETCRLRKRLLVASKKLVADCGGVHSHITSRDMPHKDSAAVSRSFGANAGLVYVAHVAWSGVVFIEVKSPISIDVNLLTVVRKDKVCSRSILLIARSGGADYSDGIPLVYRHLQQVGNQPGKDNDDSLRVLVDIR